MSPETRQGGRFGLPVLVIAPLPKQYAYFKFRCLYISPKSSDSIILKVALSFSPL